MAFGDVLLITVFDVAGGGTTALELAELLKERTVVLLGEIDVALI